MVVYLDVVLLENFIVNSFLLYIALQSIRVRIKITRLILSSLVGCTYVLTLIYDFPSIFLTIPFKILIAMLMVWILMRKKDLWMLFKGTALYMLYSMLLAGSILFLSLDISSYDLSYIKEFSYKKILLSIMVMYLLINRLVIFIKDRKISSQYIFNIEIGFKDYVESVQAFLDTGNELREPITNLPVIVVERDIFNKFNIKSNELFHIPYKVINNNSGCIDAFKAKYVKVYTDRNKYHFIDAMIGVSDGSLSNFNEYKALLSRGTI